MALSDYVETFGQHMREHHGERVHKLAVDAGFNCPNRDGARGRGGCTFCNNNTFNPSGQAKAVRRHEVAAVEVQLAAGRAVIAKRTRAQRYLAYFQAYTNTYGDTDRLEALYDDALAQPGVIGLAIGTRPDCVPVPVLDLLARYRDAGKVVWLELGLQSSFDHTLARVNRGHGYGEYREAVRGARARGLPVCTHLIAGLPGETATHARVTLARVLDEGVDGIKIHPLHVVKGTQLANDWRRGEYRPLAEAEYVNIVADLVEMTPPGIVFHRLTGTCAPELLLAPDWCSRKWRVLNGIEAELRRRGARQGAIGLRARRSH
jgi:hypothetical protein